MKCVYLLSAILFTVATIFTGCLGDINNKSIDNSSQGQNRVPILIPGKCPENQLYYPVNKTEWECDCAPGFIYHEADDTCYEAFKKGPCPKGQLFVLWIKSKKPEETRPQCVKDLCQKENQVLFRGQCWELGKPGGPCGNIQSENSVLEINATTLLPDCIKREADPGLFLINVPMRCAPGTKRFGKGCRQSFRFY